ncbi:MAG: EAL domain-containing protein [Candidatus Thiodiazotropha sp.]
MNDEPGIADLSEDFTYPTPYRVLVVDDEASHRTLQKEILTPPRFQVLEADAGQAAMHAIRRNDFDVILLDKRLPDLDGDEVCRRIRLEATKQLIPVIMVTGFGGNRELISSLRAGATDFISKPYSSDELIARVTAAAEHKRLLDQLENVEFLYFVIARMVEARDWDTGRHCIRLANNSAAFGRYLQLDHESVQLLKNLGTLHDIGKLAIPDHILLKPTSLSDSEQRVMRQHPIIGAKLCQDVNTLEPLVPLIRHHHERWDGSGYPDGLKGEEIPFLARVFQLLDIYDALAGHRPYKAALQHREIVALMETERDQGLLDPELTDRFLDFLKLHKHQLMLPFMDIRPQDDTRIIDTFYQGMRELRSTDDRSRLADKHDLWRDWIDDRLLSEAPTILENFTRSAQLNRRFSAILDSTSVGLYGLDTEGRVTFVNRAALRMLGHEESDLLNRSHHEIVHHSHPDGTPYPRSECPIQQSLKSGKPNQGQEIFFASNGAPVPVEYTCTPLLDRDEIEGVVVTFQDVSERIRVKREQRLSASVFDHSHDAIMVTDRKGIILKINRAFREITGYTDHEIIGHTPELLNAGKQPPDFFRNLRETIEREGRWQGEVVNRKRDGSHFPAWVTISSVRNSEGELTHYVAIFSDITPLKLSLEQIEHLAHHDPLTGLPNRLLLNDRLKIAVRQARRENHSVALLFLDLDRFKDINDSLGHMVGDKLLLEFAARIRSQVREEDTVARLGGDEFVILINRIHSEQEVEVIARKIMAGLREPIRLDNQELVITISIGISLFPQDSRDADELIRHADAAMYHAKEQGLCEFRFYDRRMSIEAEQRVQLEIALRRALEQQAFELHYQPQVSLSSGQITGIEALVRWRREDAELLLPAAFIPLAEMTGLIEPLGEWILREACQQAAKWHRQGVFNGPISINISGVQIQRGRVVESVKRALGATGLAPSALVLELTESTIMQKKEGVLGILRELKALGIRLSVDDFGTGYSSLSYLQNLPVDQLKIDREFVKHLPDDTRGGAITKAIIDLAKGLGLSVVAEGLEMVSQCRLLTELGCDQGQGWILSRPLTAADMEQLFRDAPIRFDDTPGR